MMTLGLRLHPAINHSQTMEIIPTYNVICVLLHFCPCARVQYVTDDLIWSEHDIFIFNEAGDMTAACQVTSDWTLVPALCEMTPDPRLRG